MASIEDVAKRAGVSVATVSRALRGLPNVAPSTRARVREAAAALHYVADPYASRLAGGRTATVGLVLPMLGQWYYSQLFSGAEAVLAARGYDLLPMTVSSVAARRRFFEELPFRKRVDGLVVVDLQMSDGELGKIMDTGVAVVGLGWESTACPTLGIDDAGAARAAVEHLLALGHRRIGLISSFDDDPFRFAAPARRERGYEGALRAHGIEPVPELVVAGGFSLRGGAEAVALLAALPDPPTAVFALSDEMAIGAMQVAADLGLSVPDDLSVVGFDDHDVAEFVGLTTVRQHVVEQGEHAARMVLERLAGQGTPSRHLELPTRLVVRRSSGPPSH